MSVRKGFCLAAAAIALAAPSPAAGPVELAPGRTIEVDVPGTPPSLADLKRATHASTVRLAFRLPADYDPAKKYPVLVFLSGGDGGMGGEMHQAEPFLGGTNYILCNIPIFKRDIEGETIDDQLMVTPMDASYAVPAFRVLFDELHRLVPNIDDARSVLAGFSNGAASVGLILFAGDPTVLSRFGAFVLIEGGFFLASDHVDGKPDLRFRPATFEAMGGKRVLVMYGDQTNPPDRIPWIRDARKTVEALRAAGVKTEEMPMANVGHDFPPPEIEKARRWVLSGG